MSVTCNKCGEELMGAVNRCWKCGTQFQRIEGAQIPPIRRSPVLATYLVAAAVPVKTAPDEVYVASLAEDASLDSPTTHQANESLKSQAILNLKRCDYPSLSTSALAILTIVIGFYSYLAIPLGLITAIASVHLLNHRRSTTRWVGFALGVLALIVALLGIVSVIYFWWMGSSLSLAIWGQ